MANPFDNIEKALTPDSLPEGSVTVEVEQTTIAPEEEISVVLDDEGGATINIGEDDQQEVSKHEENLAEKIEDSELTKISLNILDLYESDMSSRDAWERTYSEGLKLLGFQYEEKTQPFRGASGVHVPLMTEAIIQFCAQAMKELMPSGGPVRTQVLGTPTKKKEQQAQRIKDFMNYQITTVMKEYTPDFDQMLWYVGYGGSAFKKVYYDQSKKRCVSPFILPDNFVMPYDGSSNPWENERCIQVVQMSGNELKKRQIDGTYRDIDLQESTPEISSIREAEDRVSGIDSNENDLSYTLLEAHIHLDLPGYSNKDGLKLPYIVTIDKDSGEVLSIYRNYDEDDEDFTPRQYFVHYMFLPGPGCMGYGLVHLIGNLTRSATAALRQLLDAGTLANLPAGFKARGLRIADDDKPLQPGEFRDVDAGGGDLQSSLLPLPYKEPSQTLFTLLGFCIDMGRRLSSISDMQIGDGNQQAAVGTTIAMLERGAMVMSGIHKRLHYAQKLEFELMASAFHKYLPDEYPYDVPGADRTVLKEDFDERIDIIPSADPNIYSAAQRITMAQTQLQLAQSNPQIHNIYEAYRRMYEALGTRDIDMILKPDDTQTPQPKDPATENAEALDGKSLKAFPGQEHDAHILTHLLQGMSPIVQQNPLAANNLTKHILEHVRLKSEEMTEAELFKQFGENYKNAVTDIEKEAKVAQMVVQNMQQLREASQQLSGAGQPDPIVQLKEKELELRAQDTQRKAQESAQKMNLQAQDMQMDAQLAQERLQATRDIADEKADIARERVAQEERKQMRENRGEN